jgi:hypothetical protein
VQTLFERVAQPGKFGVHDIRIVTLAVPFAGEQHVRWPLTRLEQQRKSMGILRLAAGFMVIRHLQVMHLRGRPGFRLPVGVGALQFIGPRL